MSLESFVFYSGPALRPGKAVFGELQTDFSGIFHTHCNTGIAGCSLPYRSTACPSPDESDIMNEFPVFRYLHKMDFHRNGLKAFPSEISLFCILPAWISVTVHLFGQSSHSHSLRDDTIKPGFTREFIFVKAGYHEDTALAKGRRQTGHTYAGQTVCL